MSELELPDWTTLKEAIIVGDRKTSDALTQEYLARSIPPMVIIDNALIPAMDVVGRKFQNNEYFVPELLRSARAMKVAMVYIRPILAETGADKWVKVIMGTVKGDLHDIGKNLVGSLMSGAGFEVIDLGIDTPAEDFIAAVREHDAKLVGMSALLTTTMLYMKDVLTAFEKEGLRDTVKIIVGGAPVTKQYAQDIGADGYAPNATSAVELSKTLLGAAVS